MKEITRFDWRYWIIATIAAGAFAAGGGVQAKEQLPPGARIVRIEAWPAQITLQNPFDYKQIFLTAHLDTGEQVDVTRMAHMAKSGDIITISSRGLVSPKTDGKGQLKFTVLDQTIAVPVQVSGQQIPYKVSFVRDVMPTLSKLGCNAGTCHGSAKGKNGFKLSLRGYDPLFDHQALTDDLSGRRFNRAAPEQSLMLLKPSGGAPHTGGVVMHPGDRDYELLRAWIADGVRLDLDSPRVKSIAIFPKSPMVPRIGMKRQMAILATYTDGSVRDVTAQAFIESSNQEVAKVDKQGLVSTERRGEATMLARYEGNYTATTLIVMGDRSGFVWQPVPENNYIDTLVYEKLKKIKVLPSDLCTDTEFIRRVYLDLTGLPPQPLQVRAFLADQRPTKIKRDELVERLIGASPDYVEQWTNKWADLLQVNRKFLGEKGANALRTWIRHAVAANMPYDKFVYTILTASGSTVSNPPASYYKVLRDPGVAMENTTQLFLAVRFNCNKCHDHPFERWTQDQYYNLAAFFAQVDRKEDPRFKGQKVGGTDVEQPAPLVEVISDKTTGDIKNERTGAVAEPIFPYTTTDLVPKTASRREQLARWIASKNNPYFAKSYVNRIWSYFMGVGLVEPIDDIRAGNPPTNPKLLDRMTQEFIDSGFDVRKLERTICKSRVYQQSIVTNKWNQDDDINYSHALARRLPAEVLCDAIYRATGSVSHLPGLPPGARAAQLLDSAVDLPSGFLNLFGKPPRDSACECERTTSMMLGPVLNLVNGPIVADALKDPNNRIGRILARDKDNGKVVKDLFLAFLCRSPTPKELANGIQALESSKDESAQMAADYAKVAGNLAAYEKSLDAKQLEWEKNLKNVAAWTILEPVKATSSAGTVLTKKPDGSLLASGQNPSPEVYTITASTKLSGITAIRLEVLPDPSLPKQGPGRAPNGNFVLNEFRVAAAPMDQPKAQAVALHHAQADYSQPQFAVAGAIDDKPDTGWAVAGAEGRAHVAIFETKQPIAFPQGATLTFTLEQRFAGKLHNLGRLRLAVTTAKPPISLKGPQQRIVKILLTAAGKRTEAQKAELRQFYHSQDAKWVRLSNLVAQQPMPPVDQRRLGAEDLAWVLINSPAFLFNN